MVLNDTEVYSEGLYISGL